MVPETGRARFSESRRYALRMTGDAPEPGRWRRSSFSGPAGSCVEAARFSDGHIEIRGSRYGDFLAVMPDEGRAFLAGAKAGQFDDLAPVA